MNELLNCTPHAIEILSSENLEKTKMGWQVRPGSTPVIIRTIPPCGVVPRASQGPSLPGEPVDGVPTQIPGAFGAPTDLPEPKEGIYRIVSILTVQAAKAAGRSLTDLLSPGDLVRDQEGRIVGALNLARAQ